MTSIQRRAALCLMVFLAGGCANWHPVQVPQPRPLDERTVLQFHVQVGKKDSLVRLHAVQFTKDSVSGIYWIEHTSCDTCRTSYALKDVTRAQIGQPGKSAWILTVPFFALAGFTLLFCLALCGRGEI